MKESTIWYWKYKTLDLKIKGLNRMWRLTSIPWKLVSRTDHKRVKGLAWSDPKAAPMMRRAFDAVDKEMGRTRKLLPMAKRRSDYYLEYLRTKR